MIVLYQQSKVKKMYESGYAWRDYKKNVVKMIAEILEREYGNPNHLVVAELIFDVFHPEAHPA